MLTKISMGRDMIGQKFGRPKILKTFRNGEYVFADCMCDCGKYKAIRVSHIKSGASKSCGCLLRQPSPFRNGATKGGRMTRTYSIWHGMLRRCADHKRKCFARYGGRGISVCDRWKKFANFLADMGEAPMGLSLDRIDNNGNYEPGNCRWATQAEQCRNTRNTKLSVVTVRKIKLALAAWMKPAEVARLCGVSEGSVSNIKLGKSWASVLL